MALRTTVAAVASKLSRLTVAPCLSTGAKILPPQCGRCIHSQSSPLLFHATSQLWGAPMKKKKKVDPSVLLARENKRKKKIEKQMKRLEKFGRRFKPIEEIEGDLKIRRELEMRRRPAEELAFEEKERRALLHKEWARVRMREYKQECTVWARVVNAQQRALDELRFESEELYQMAIQPDETLIPLEFKGPTATPPIKGYQAPDGEYIDVTKTYD
ncbi:large ribosomal subunit protein mL40-like [Babylonia areolata]|uniref:large ribosomal subunit protein mL40-like n=1 Tax=Babylonia areolata TaxID=304850 RepID=UPI003FD64B92